MVPNLGPRPPGDPAAMRAFARHLLHAADDMQSHAARARHAELGFTAPSAARISARVSGWLTHVDRDIQRLRDLAQRIMLESGGVERAQRHHDRTVREYRAREAR